MRVQLESRWIRDETVRGSVGLWLLAVFETLVRWIVGWDGMGCGVVIVMILGIYGTGRALDSDSLSL